MSKPRSKDSGRFRIYVSDRSGFEFGFIPLTTRPNAYTREAGKPVQDINVRVAPDEFDTPPPSNKPLGGEGDISGEPRVNSNPAVDANVYIVPPQSVGVVYYVTSSQTIPWNENPVVYVGALANITMASNPQIAPAHNGKSLAFQCVGSNITLINGSGLTFDFAGTQIMMESGSIITTIYNKTDNTWHITSFNKLSGGF